MAFYLSIDIGNTRTKVGEFQESKLEKVHYFSNDEVIEKSKMLDEMELKGLILSSVNEKVSKALDLENKPYPAWYLIKRLEYQSD